MVMLVKTTAITVMEVLCIDFVMGLPESWLQRRPYIHGKFSKFLRRVLVREDWDAEQ